MHSASRTTAPHHEESTIRISVHVHPGSATPRVGGSHDGALVVRVRARAVDGLATAEVLERVAQAFNVRPRTVTLVRGAASRTKVLDVLGDDPVLLARYEQLLGE